MIACYSAGNNCLSNVSQVLVTTIDALGHFLQNNYSTVGGDGGCRVGEVRASTTSLMPDHKGFKLQ